MQGSSTTRVVGNGGSYPAYFCPHCDAELNPGAGPIVRLRGGLDGPCFHVTVDVFLPAALGVYGRVAGEHVRLEDGALVQLACPACGSSLSSREDDDLAQIRMLDGEGRTFAVSFNKRYGRRSTFVLDAETRLVDREFGADVEAFRPELNRRVNFFGA